MMLARLDHMGRLAWLGVTGLAFWVAVPLGLMTLAFLYGSGRLREFAGMRTPGQWTNLRDGVSHSFKRASGAGGSGNAAFDIYRQAELERLEQEQQEFRTYIEQLRRARDKAEFDQFMADRRRVKPADQSAEKTYA